MALNENLRFENVESAVKRAFLRTPEKVLLSPPTAPKRDLQHVFLIGGAMQVWVPNLEPQHVTAVPVRG